jgi:hypothetical protein
MSPKIEWKINILRAVVLSIGLVVTLVMSNQINFLTSLFIFLFFSFMFSIQLVLFEFIKEAIILIMNKNSKSQDLSNSEIYKEDGN